MLSRNTRETFDWPLFLVTALISIIGVANLYSSTSSSAGGRGELYIQQIYWLTLGGGLAVLANAVDYRRYERQAWAFYVIGVISLILVFLLGRSIRGSQRWIPIGLFSLQPSEFMKLFLILALGKYLHNDPKTDGRRLTDLIVPGAIVAAPLALILKQPDLGTSMIILAIFSSIMFLTRLKLRTVVVLVATITLSAPLTWNYLFQDYQRERIRAFLDPETDLLDSGWHTHQSIVSIGSGGWFGKGFLKGTQNQHRFLPDQHTDFPFPVWAEEQGFVGVTFLLLLYLFLVLWGIKIAAQSRDRFGAVIAVGVSSMIFWHTVINMGMVSGLLPVVGVTLPLFSYGGSSVVTFMIGIGLLMNVSMRRFSF